MDTEEGKRSAAPLPKRGAEWVDLSHSDRMSPRRRRRLDKWLAESPEHVRDYESAQHVWRVSGDIEKLGTFRSELAMLRDTAASRLRAFPLRRPERRWLAIAAAVLLVIAPSAWYVWVYAPSTYITAPGEQRIVTRLDGSTIAINTSTRLAIAYSSKERAVVIDRGEAMFEIAPDAQRPFVVRAGRGVIRTVGTSFNVITDGRLVTVTVLDGQVEVVTTSKVRTAAAILLGAGEATAYDRDGRAVNVDPTRASAERILAWRGGRLHFDDWPIERAIREHHRYGGKPIRLSDPALGQERIGGKFRIGDTQGLAIAIAEAIRGEVVEQDNDFLLTRPEPEPKPNNPP